MPKQSKVNDIAIVGISCRLPGADNYDEYWDNLINGVCSISEVPEQRWNWQDYYGDPNLEVGKTNVKYAGFIKDVDKFDPLFFGIPPKEAQFMDPQHRIFLQAAWHAVENAGYRVSQLSGSNTGVYCGVSKNDYAELMRANDIEIEPFISTGTVHSLVANRVSFLMNLRGHSETVDTACSSSFVALRRAVQDIQLGVCDSAIVGAANAILTPTMTISHNRSGMLALDGKIKAFDEKADGYVRAEGVAAIYIKPLAKAEEDGDYIWGTVKAVAVNHGGRGNFLTSPSAKAQAEVIEKALDEAEVECESISYIECHGTGTKLGDPIEIEGLKQAFNKASGDKGIRDWTHTCALGTVKPNIGHLEPAAGLAGLIKVLLSMKNKQLPAVANFCKQNPYIDLENSPFKIIEQSQPWLTKQYPRRAGVSSIGMGGVNAHVILEEYIDERNFGEEFIEDGFFIPLSAKNGQLKDSAKMLHKYLSDGYLSKSDTTEREFLRNLSFTLCVGRDNYTERTAFIIKNISQLKNGIQAFIAGQVSTGSLYCADNSVNADLIDFAEKWVVGKEETDSRFAPEIKGKRIPVPGYAFAHRRCWFPESKDIKAENLSTKSSVKIEIGKSPIVTGTGNSQKDYALSLHDHMYYLSQHFIKGKLVVPGAAHFQFICNTLWPNLSENQGVEFKNVYWLRPWPTEEKKTLTIKIKENEQGEFSYDFNDGVQSYVTGSVRLTEQGLAPKQAYGTFDFDKVQSRSEIYQSLREYGIEHGEKFQVINSIQLAKRAAVAQIEYRSSEGESVLYANPCLVDAIFQVVTKVDLADNSHGGRQFVPFMLEKARFYGRLPDKCFIQAASNAENKNFTSYNMELYDKRRKVFAEFQGFKKKALKERIVQEDSLPDQVKDNNAIELISRQHNTNIAAPTLHYYTSSWFEDRSPTRKSAGCTILCLPDESLDDRLKGLPDSWVILRNNKSREYANRNNHYYSPFDSVTQLKETFINIEKNFGGIDSIVFLINETVEDITTCSKALDREKSCLLLVQALIRSKLKQSLQLMYCVANPEDSIPVHHGLVGFARTLAYEYPKISMRLMLTDQLDRPAQLNQISNEITCEAPSSRLVSYSKGKRVVEKIISLPELDAKATSFREDGVIVIFGGVGGIGKILSHHIIKHYKSKIALVGRSRIDNKIQKVIDDLNSQGRRVAYYSADARDYKQVDDVLDNIRSDFEKITGVVYGAGIIQDDFILRKKSDSFIDVLSTKVLGAIYVDDVTKQDNLDFFVAFSSIAALMPNQGQADYATGNCFLDAFVKRRNLWRTKGLRSGRSIAVNWPLWKNGGMTVKAEEVRHLEEVFGMAPLETDLALSLFDRVLAGDGIIREIDNIVMIDGDKNKIDKHLKPADEVYIPPQNASHTSQYHANSDIAYFLRGIVGKTLQRIVVEEEVSRTFSELGIDSEDVILLAREFENSLDIKLNPTVFFIHNTIESLTEHLVRSNESNVCDIFYRRHDMESKRLSSLIDAEKAGGDKRIFAKSITTQEFYMQGHIYEGRYNFPGACYVEMALQSANIIFSKPSVLKLTDVAFLRRLSSFGEVMNIQLRTPRENDGRNIDYEINVSEGTGETFLCSSGKIVRQTRDTRVSIRDFTAIREDAEYVKRHDDVVGQLIAEGDQVSYEFIAAQDVYVTGDEAIGKISISENIEETHKDYILHPALLAGFMQTARVLNNPNKDGEFNHVIPMGIDDIEVYGTLPKECYAYATRQAGKQGTIRRFNGVMTDEKGNVLVKISGFTIKQGSIRHELVNNVHKPSIEQPEKNIETNIAAGNMSVGVHSDQSKTVLLLKNLMSPLLGLSENEIDEDAPFESYINNSIIIVEINRKLEEQFGEISKTLLFEYDNLRDLALYFSDREEVSGSNEDKVEQCIHLVKGIIAPVLGLSTEELDEYAAFENYIGNSVVIVEVNKQLEDYFGEISKTLLFEYENIAELAEYFSRVKDDIRSRSERQAAGNTNNLSGSSPIEHVIVELKNIIAPILGFDSSELDEYANFEEFITNSIVIVEINNKLATHYGNISKTLMFEYENIFELANFFAGEESATSEQYVQSDNTKESLNELTELLKATIAAVLGLSEDEIDENAKFDDYINNSVVIVEINTRLEQLFGSLSKTIMFEYENITALSQHLFEANYNVDFISDKPNDLVLGGGEKGIGLVNQLKEIIAPVLGFLPMDLDETASFESYISNSIVIVEINRALESVFGELSKTLLFECENIVELANYIENDKDPLQTIEHGDVVKNNNDEKTDVTTQVFHKNESLNVDSKVVTQRHPEIRPGLSTPKEGFPLTEMQESFIVGRQISQPYDRVGCHVYCEFDVENPDVSKLNVAWDRLVQHHQMLRCKFLPNNTQQIMDHISHFDIAVDDLCLENETRKKVLLEGKRARMSHRVYDPFVWPLFDISVSVLSDSKARVHFSIDELIVDGASWHMLMEQWRQLYNNPDYSLPEHELTFGDCVVASKNFTNTDKYQQDLTYWTNKLDKLPIEHAIQVLDPKPYTDAQRAFTRQRLQMVVENTEWTLIKQLAKRLHASPTSLVLAVFSSVIASYNGGKSFPILMTYLNRPPVNPDLQHIVGPFISSNIFIHNEDGETINKKIVSTHEQLWNDLEHVSVSGIKALREVQRKKRQSHFISIVFTSFLGLVDENISSWKENVCYTITQTPQVYWDHQMFEKDGALHCSWDVVFEYFPSGVLEKIFDAFQTELVALATTNSDVLGRFPYVEDARLKQTADSEFV